MNTKGTEHWNCLLAGSNGLDGDKERCGLVRVRLVATKGLDSRDRKFGLSSFVWFLIRLAQDGKQNKNLNDIPWQWMKSIEKKLFLRGWDWG